MNYILVQYSTTVGALRHVVVTVIHTSPCFGLVFSVSSKYARLISKPNTFIRATIMAVIACTLVISVLTLRIVQFRLETTLMGIQLQHMYLSYDKNDLETDKINLTSYIL